jgi:RNA polymerase sigma-70 factor, ECF subfamily
VTGPSEYLLRQLEAPRRNDLAGIDCLDGVLASQYADALMTWPQVALPEPRYLDQLARCIRDRAGEPAEHVITTMPAADLYLATACSDGRPGALEAFRDAYVPAVRQALGRVGAPAALIDEAVQQVLIMLFVDGQIAGYRGRGTLRNWVRSIAVKTGRRLLGGDTAIPVDERAELAVAVGDPELDLLRARHREQVRDAFAAAFAQLTERQRNVLRQYYLDGLTIDQIGSLYQINRATAARWVASARLALVAATRAMLVDRWGVAASDVDSVIRLVRSQLSVSVRELG